MQPVPPITVSTSAGNVRKAVAVVFALVLAVALAACGDGDGADRAGGAQPNVQGTALIDGDLSALPMPQASEPVGEASVTDEAITQSFQIAGLTPEQVLADFAAALADEGWDSIEGPQERGTQGWTGEWARDGDVLEVSATPFDDGQVAEATVTQFSLVLRRA